MLGSVIDWRADNAPKKRFDVLDSAVSTREDGSSTAHLISTVNSLPALDQSKVYANRLFALQASIHPDLSRPARAPDHT
jgi:hypothetical protein